VSTTSNSSLLFGQPLAQMQAKVPAGQQQTAEADPVACCVIQESTAVSYWFCSSLDSMWHKGPATVSGRPNTFAAFAPTSADSSSSFVKEMVQGSEVDRRIVITLRGASGRDGVMYWPAFSFRETLFVNVPSAALDNPLPFGFKECIVATMELADAVLDCKSIVFCLNKNRPDINSVLRSFLFAGFAFVHPSQLNVSDKFVLVGQSL
ncbi:hypothetical protein HK405_012916, partial [Cladochytrium tenue]